MSKSPVAALPLEDAWLDLEPGGQLTTTVSVSETVRAILTRFDVTDAIAATTSIYRAPEVGDDWRIGLIVGTSGSGKSTMLKSFGDVPVHAWTNASIADHFERPVEALSAVGLNSVPSWLRPFSILSSGEQHRANLARTLVMDAGCIDEFTSVVDRNVARSSSHAIHRHLSRREGRFVFASCHHDVVPWLRPDWIVDLDIGRYCLKPRECLQRRPLSMVARRVKRDAWNVFSKHHYLSGSLHGFSVCYGAFIDDSLIGFCAVLPFPNGHLRNAWREHRTVVLPEWQGFGIGPRLTDVVAAVELGKGHVIYSKVAHPSLIGYRDKSPLWERLALSTNRTGTKSSWDHWKENTLRSTASHRYVGPPLSSTPDMAMDV